MDSQNICTIRVLASVQQYLDNWSARKRVSLTIGALCVKLKQIERLDNDL